MKTNDRDSGKSPGLHISTRDSIREMIVSGALTPDIWIDEMRLGAELGVSRTPVREALRVLESEGLVEIVPRRGARIREASPGEIRDLFAVIAALERLAAETLAANATESELAELHDLHQQMKKRHESRDREAYFELNHHIHGLMIELAHNRELARTHTELLARARQPRFVAITSDNRWDESIKEHELILAAIETRNGQYAGELLFRHVLKTGDAFIASMGAGQVT